MRALLTALLMAAPVFACSCASTGTPCSAMSGTAVVFVGRVLTDGEPTRVAIEERLYNVPKDLEETGLDTFVGTSCSRQLESGERYVIFAGRRDNGKLFVAPCSWTFRVRGNENILDALRNKTVGGNSWLVGTVRRFSGTYLDEKGVAGATVTVDSQHETISDAFGTYEIRDLAPGRYQIQVKKAGFVQASEHYHWSGEQENERGTVMAGPNSCEVCDLSMWPTSRISGSVFDSQGDPAENVTVQAFAVFGEGGRGSYPLRTTTTDSQGHYAIEPLPGGEYVIGVNATEDTDESPYPRALREGVRIADGDQLDGVNIVLRPKRKAAILRVHVVGVQGEPYLNARIDLENSSGVQRWDQGLLEIPVYVGEKYKVTASGSGVDDEYLEGSATVEIVEDSPTVTIVLIAKALEEQ